MFHVDVLHLFIIIDDVRGFVAKEKSVIIVLYI